MQILHKGIWSVGLLLAAAIIGGTAHADETLAQKIEAYFAEPTANGDFNGVVLLSRSGAPEYRGLFGTASDAGRSQPGEQAFRVASLTKTFTSGAILLLEKEGKLDRNDLIAKYLPEFPKGDIITIRFLLLHAAGLDNPDYDADAWDGVVTTTALVENIAAKPFLFEPGTRSQYSNAGYNVLARIIEIVSGQAYGEYLSTRFFEPLGMTGTWDGGTQARDEGAMAGFVPGPGPEFMAAAELDNLNLFTGSGSLISTASDLAKWADAVAEERFFSILDQEWPFGWGRVEAEGRQGIEQTGAVAGFVSALRIFPDEKASVVLLSNVENGQWAMWGNDMAVLMFGGQAEPGASFVEQPLAATTMARFPGQYDGDGFAVRVEAADGHLWAYFMWEPKKANYLTPLGGNDLGVRGIGAKLLFSGDGNDLFSGLIVHFPDSQIPLERAE